MLQCSLLIKKWTLCNGCPPNFLMLGEAMYTRELINLTFYVQVLRCSWGCKLTHHLSRLQPIAIYLRGWNAMRAEWSEASLKYSEADFAFSITRSCLPSIFTLNPLQIVPPLLCSESGSPQFLTHLAIETKLRVGFCLKRTYLWPPIITQYGNIYFCDFVLFKEVTCYSLQGMGYKRGWGKKQDLGDKDSQK